MVWGIISIIVGLGLGVYVCNYGASRPLKIEFEKSPLDWILVAFVALTSVLFAFVLDLFFSRRICELIGERSDYLHVVKKFFENGLLIPIFSAIISFIFEKRVESLNLHYSRLYNERVSKICFSVLVLSFCLVVQFLIIPKYPNSDPLVDFLFNRILMWIMTVVGTWIGFGFACKGSIEKDNELINANNEGIMAKEKMQFWIPIIIGLVMCCIVLFLSATKFVGTLVVVSILVAFSFLVSGLITAIIIKRKTNPSPRRSLKLFLKARNNLEKGIVAQGQYGKVEYELFENELKIKPRTVIYEGHQDDDDFKELFAGPIIEFSDFDEAFKKLEALNKMQREYIQKGFDDCAELEKQKKRKKIK